MAVGLAAASNAQQAPTAHQDEIERIQQEYADQLRRSTLVGASDDLAIELPNGEVIPIARRNACSPPVSRGGVIQVDCTALDGPAYYFDESTRAMIETCSFWFPEPKRCPPKAWPIDVSGCDGTVPQDIEGTWRLYAVPGSSGFSPMNGGWTMTLSEETVRFDFYGTAEVERAYKIIDRDDQRFSVELRDDLSDTAAIDIELAPCGLFVEADPRCNAFCDTFAKELGTPTDEQLREIVAQSLGDGASETALEEILRGIPDEAERRQQRPQPVFPERAFFRNVVEDR
jgi:hypothetical protein